MARIGRIECCSVYATSVGASKKEEGNGESAVEKTRGVGERKRNKKARWLNGLPDFMRVQVLAGRPFSASQSNRPDISEIYLCY